MIELRATTTEDLPVFFRQQLDPDANRMAAFTRRDRRDWKVFEAHWAKILADPTTTNRTILLDGLVAGYVASFERDGDLEVTYWLGKEHWNKGVATGALASFVRSVTRRRPLFARVAHDNAGSLRVLEKCGFSVIKKERGFAQAREAEIEELVLALNTPPPPTP